MDHGLELVNNILRKNTEYANAANTNTDRFTATFNTAPGAKPLNNQTNQVSQRQTPKGNQMKIQDKENVFQGNEFKEP